MLNFNNLSANSSQALTVSIRDLGMGVKNIVWPGASAELHLYRQYKVIFIGSKWSRGLFRHLAGGCKTTGASARSTLFILCKTCDSACVTLRKSLRFLSKRVPFAVGLENISKRTFLIDRDALNQSFH